MNREIVEHPIQAIMSRTGSFPLSVAYNLLKKYCKKNSMVFDAFCGKGTTLLAARMLGHHAYGMDIAPEAVVCTLAKLVNVNLNDVIWYVETLPSNNSSLNAMHNILPAVTVYFHTSTLSQILNIRDKLVIDSQSKNKNKKDNAIFTLASLLGILHGHASFSLSIPCAHAYSMAPAYVSRFAATHDLKPPKRNVKLCLIQKISRCLKSPLPMTMNFDVRRGSALYCSKVFPELIGKVDVILTSPPYLNAQTYAKDNWLRLWLLGYDYKTIKHQYIETGSITRYGEYMQTILQELKLLLKSGGHLICIAGDVKLSNRSKASTHVSQFETGRFIAELCSSERIGFRIEHYEEHRILSNHRYFHSLSNTCGHEKRDLVERIFVAIKP